MKYQFSELVDIKAISGLLSQFHYATGFRADVFSLDGEPLTAAARWEDVCLEFHRNHPISSRRCIESDTTTLNEILAGRDSGIYTCKNGMVDAGARVIVGGEHVANIICGQLFCEKPDLGYFRRQAQELGLDEDRYIDKIKKVQISSRKKLETAVNFISRLAVVLGELGLRHLRELEAEEALRASEAKYRDIFENAVEGIFQTAPDGRYLNVNPAFCRMHEYESEDEVLQQAPLISDHLFSPSDTKDLFFRLLREHKRVEAFESQTKTRQGHSIWLSINARIIGDDTETGRFQGTVENITDRKRAESGMLAAQQQLEALSRTLLKRMEIERHHVAHELHDEIGQVLTVVKMGLQSIKEHSASSVFAERLDDNIAAIKRAIDQVRSLSVNLRPSVLDDLGLVAALQWLADSARSNGDLDVEVIAGSDVEPCLGANLATTCFRVAQEALTNVLRHAKASQAKIELRAKGSQIVLIVSDDGIGFDADAARRRVSNGASFGLLAMQERTVLSGGVFSIDSKAGKGSKITATFPLRDRVEQA
jgi:PAS domain S-box-containing protein